MNDLASRVRQALAFDIEHDSTDGDSADIKYLFEPRLSSIHAALVDAVKALEEIARSGSAAWMGEANKALTRIERALGGEK